MIRAAHLLPATDARARLAVAAVDRGASTATELGQFLYGAWTRPLGEAAVVEIVARLGTAGGTIEIEHGLGILDQWTENRKGSSLSPELRSLALDLIGQSNRLPDRPSSMIGLRRSRLIQALGLQFEERLNATIDVFRSLQSFPDPHDLEVLDALAADDAQRTVDAIVDLIAGQDEDEGGFKPWLMWLAEAEILSRLERATSPELVIDTVIAQVDQKEWARLVDHIDLSPEEPDALLITLLERSDDSRLRGRALFRFMYPETVYTGPESAYLRARRQIAAQWSEGAPSQGGYRTWLEELIQDIDQRIDSVEMEEAERD